MLGLVRLVVFNGNGALAQELARHGGDGAAAGGEAWGQSILCRPSPHESQAGACLRAVQNVTVRCFSVGGARMAPNRATGENALRICSGCSALAGATST